MPLPYSPAALINQQMLIHGEAEGIKKESLTSSDKNNDVEEARQHPRIRQYIRKPLTPAMLDQL